MTVGPAVSHTISSLSLDSSSAIRCNKEKTKFFPSPRINAGMAVKNNILYIYGGIVEEGNREHTLHDFYSLSMYISKYLNNYCDIIFFPKCSLCIYIYLCTIMYILCIYIFIYLYIYIFIYLDYRKLDEWKTLMTDDLSTQIWFDSSEDSSENSEEECDKESIDS